jgi:hypothetical protein
MSGSIALLEESQGEFTGHELFCGYVQMCQLVRPSGPLRSFMGHLYRGNRPRIGQSFGPSFGPTRRSSLEA